MKSFQSPIAAPRNLGNCVAWLWPALLLTVPVTSLTLLVSAPGQVRPLSGVIAVIALPCALTVLWRTGGWRSPALLAIVGVVLAALASGVPLLIYPPAGEDAALVRGLVLKAAASLLAGLATYLLAAAALTPRHGEDPASRLHQTLAWLLTALAGSVLLALIQVLSLGPFAAWRDVVVAISGCFSAGYTDSHAAPFVGRGHGLAFEPSYLASQLILLALPLGAFALAVGRFRLGAIGLFLGVAGVWVTGSRAGIASALLIVALAVGLLAFQRQRRVALIAVTLTALACGVGWSLHRGNAYVTAMVVAPKAKLNGQSGDVTAYAMARGFGPRLACAEAALLVARDHPWTGCGLGLLPLAMGPHLPMWAIQEEYGEVRAMYERSDGTLPKPFAMLTRLPGEFGGLGLVAATVAIILQIPWRALRGPVLMLAATGLLALLLDSLFMASFALPGPWILLAALAAWAKPSLIPR